MNPEFIDRLATGLAGPGYFIEDSFLSDAEVQSLLADFSALRSKFSRAKIGRGTGAGSGAGTVSGSEIKSEVRRDSTLWFDPTLLTANQNLLWSRLEALRLGLNERLMLGLWELEGHFAHYPPGGFYRKHLDRFQSDDARTVSIVFYLNENWQPADGGSLRIYEGEKTTDIEPRAGRLVCFLSERIEHEVLEAFKDRKSFAGWYRRRS